MPFSFLLIVEDTYNNSGLTVVTGLIQTGILNVGDYISVASNDSGRAFTLRCDGIERSGQLWDKAVEGDRIGIAFRNNPDARKISKRDTLFRLSQDKNTTDVFAMMVDQISDKGIPGKCVLSGYALTEGTVHLNDRLGVECLGFSNEVTCCGFTQNGDSMSFRRNDFVRLSVTRLEGEPLKIGQFLYNKSSNFSSYQSRPKDPWDNIRKRYPIGSVHRGMVVQLGPNGVFVEMEEGLVGLIHITDLTWDTKVKKPSDFTKVGDTIDVVVLDMDESKRRMALSHKLLERNPWNMYEQLYVVGSVHKGTIVRMEEKYAVIELDEGGEGLTLPEYLIKKNGMMATLGETLLFMILDFNKDEKMIVLSHTHTYQSEQADTSEGALYQVRAKRVALVVGNSRYIYQNPLRNCANDADAFSRELKRFDFDVYLLLDANTQMMQEVIDDFCREMGEYEAALVFFSGHGMQHMGKTYITPTDLSPKMDITSSAFSCFCVDDIIQKMDKAGCPTKIIILDSCRSIPRDITPGIPRGLDNVTAQEVFVAFSTSPGQVAYDSIQPTDTHSPFMKAILEAFNEPPVPIYDFFKIVAKKMLDMTGGFQRPWSNDNLTRRDFYLNK